MARPDGVLMQYRGLYQAATQRQVALWLRPHSKHVCHPLFKLVKAAAAAADQPADEPRRNQQAGVPLSRVLNIFQVVKDPACNRCVQ